MKLHQPTSTVVNWSRAVGLFGLILALGLLTGCTTAPDYQPADRTLPGEYDLLHPPAADSTLPGYYDFR
jgi:hypothetical protein